MVTFNDLLSWSGTNLFEAGDALVAASHKYEQVNADLKKDGLGDGLSGQTFEAEAKARRILADDAEDLWTGLSKAGNDLKDASETVNTIKNSASSTQSSVSAAGLKIKDDNTVAVKDQQSGASASTSITSYQNEVDRLVEQAGDTVTFVSSVYAEIAKLDDAANGPSPEVVNHGERPPNPNWTPSQVNDWWTSLTDAQRQNIINKHPAWIGNRAGIPSTVRDKANRKWLEIMVKDIDREVEDFDSSKKTMFIFVASAAFLAGIALVVSIFLVQQIVFHSKILLEKQNTISRLDKNLSSVDELKKNIRVLDTNTALNSIKSSSESNALQTILDALPDNANADALGASLKNKFIDTTTGVTIQNLTVAQSGSDSESSESTSENAISFTMEVSGPAEKLKELLTKLEASIRVIDLKTVEIQRNEDRLSLVVRGVAYYEPAQTIQLENKVVKP